MVDTFEAFDHVISKGAPLFQQEARQHPNCGEGGADFVGEGLEEFNFSGVIRFGDAGLGVDLDRGDGVGWGVLGQVLEHEPMKGGDQAMIGAGGLVLFDEAIEGGDVVRTGEAEARSQGLPGLAQHFRTKGKVKRGFALIIAIEDEHRP